MEIVGCRAEDSSCPFRPPAMLFHGISGGHIQGIMEEMERRSKSEARLAKGAQLNGRDAVRKGRRPREPGARARAGGAESSRRGARARVAVRRRVRCDRRVGYLLFAWLLQGKKGALSDLATLLRARARSSPPQLVRGKQGWSGTRGWRRPLRRRRRRFPSPLDTRAPPRQGSAARGRAGAGHGLRRAAERPGRAEAPGFQSLGLETGRSGCTRMRPPDARDAERAKAAMVGGSLAARLGQLRGLARVA